MNVPVPPPALCDAVESTSLTQWLTSLGNHVIEGETLLELSTDKVGTGIGSPGSVVLMEFRSEADRLISSMDPSTSGHPLR